MDTALRDLRVGRTARPREFYIEAGKEYLRRYGELTAACFNPSTANRNGRPDLVERYYAGREDGTVWPSLNSIKKNFDGSFSKFREELDLPPNKTGGTNRRKKGEAEPILHIRERRVEVPGAGTTWLRRQLEKAERRAERLAEQLDAERTKHDFQENPETEALRKRLADERARRREVQRELSNAIRRESRARASSSRSNRRGNAAALREVDRLTQKLVEAQDQIRDRSTSTVVPRIKTKTVTKTVKVQDEKLLQQVEKLEGQITELRRVLSLSEVGRAEALERLATIRRDAVTEAVKSERVRTAERRVAELEKQLAEQTEILIGERRVLSEEELTQLRNEGPAGPKQFIAMVKRIGRAEGTIARKAAIYDAIAAGYNWMERL